MGHIYEILFYVFIFIGLIICLCFSSYKITTFTFGKYEVCKFFSNRAVLFTIFILTVLGAIRSEVGADYNSYLRYFNRSVGYLKNVDGLEMGFIKIIEWFNILSINSEVFFAALSVIYGMLFLIYIIHESQIMKEPIVFFAIYLFTWQYMYSLNVIRSCISACCIMMCIWSIQNKRYRTLILFTILGCLFHRTTIFVVILLLFFKKFKIKPYYVLIYIVCLIPCFIFKKEIINAVFDLAFLKNIRYQSYILTGFFGERNLLSIVPVLPRFFLWIIICGVLKIQGQNEKEKYYLSLFNYNMIITLTGVYFELSWRMMLGTWIADYFVFMMTIKNIDNEHNRILFKIFIIIYLIAYFLLYAYLDQAVFPYKTIFQK